MTNVNGDVVAKFFGVRRAVMSACRAKPVDRSLDRTIEDLERYADRPMRVVVLGQNNSGKTALVNAILGREILPTAVVANTPVSVTMRYSSDVEIRIQTDCGTWHDIDQRKPFSGFGAQSGRLMAVDVFAPNPILKQFELVDTPAGYDAASSIVGADFAVWCTNITQAWAESERATWCALPKRCRSNGLLVATHSDVVGSLDDQEKVIGRLQSEAGDLFDDIVSVSSVSGSGIGVLVERLMMMVQEQRVRRGGAAKRIATRLVDSRRSGRSLSSSMGLGGVYAKSAFGGV